MNSINILLLSILETPILPAVVPGPDHTEPALDNGEIAEETSLISPLADELGLTVRDEEKIGLLIFLFSAKSSFLGRNLLTRSMSCF